MLNLVSAILVGMTIVFSFIILVFNKKRKKKNHINNIQTKKKSKINKNIIKIKYILNKKYKYIILFLFILNLFVSVYKVSDIPYGMHVDEAAMAYDAYCLANYGTDRYEDAYPVYLVNYGGGQSALYAYLSMFLIKIFGYSLFIVRLPAVIINSLAFIALYKMFKYKKLDCILILTMFSIAPYFILQSRWGLDCNLLVGMMAISTSLLMSFVRSKKIWILILSGVCFGLTLYSYAISYIIVPIFLFLTLLYLLIKKKIKIMEVLIMGIPIYLIAIPLMLFLLVNNGYINSYRGIITIPNLPYYRGTELSYKFIEKNLYIFETILSYDAAVVELLNLEYNSIPQFGTIYYMSIPFLILGLLCEILYIIKNIKKDKIMLNIIILFWAFSCVLVLLIIDDPNINKANAVFIPLIYYVAMGIKKVIKNVKILAIPILILYIINFTVFLNYYFTEYNEDYMYQIYFATSYIDALQYTLSYSDQTFYVEKNIAAQEYIHIALMNEVSPEMFNWNMIEGKNNNNYVINIEEDFDVDMNGVYIIENTNEEVIEKLEEKGFDKKEFDNILIYQK